MKKNKVVGIVTVVAAGVILLGGIFLFSKKNTYQEEYKINSDKVQQVIIESDSWATVIREADREDILIEVSGTRKVKDDIPVHIEQEQGILKVIQEKEIRDFLSNFSFGQENKITIYLPQERKDYLEVTSNSGDIKMEGTSFEEIKAISKSGEIKATKMFSNLDMVLESGSGDIKVGYKENVENLSITASSLKEEVQMKLGGVIEEKKTNKEYKGKIGKGDHQLDIRSNSGSIYIK